MMMDHCDCGPTAPTTSGDASMPPLPSNVIPFRRRVEHERHEVVLLCLLVLALAYVIAEWE